MEQQTEYSDVFTRDIQGAHRGIAGDSVSPGKWRRVLDVFTFKGLAVQEEYSNWAVASRTKAQRPSETSEVIHERPRRHLPEDTNPQLHF